MAEIRIPTDRIPADILLRLQAIGQSVMNPVSDLVAPQSPSTFSTSTFPSEIVSSASCSTNDRDSVPGLSTSSPSRSSTLPVTTLVSTTRADVETSAVVPSSDRQKSLFCTESDSPAKITEEKKDPNFRRLMTTSALTKPSEANSSLTTDFCPDEVDGGDGIVHAFCEPHPHHQVAGMCYDAVDDSDIVRIFSEEESTVKSRKATGTYFPSDDSDIVRIFPNVDDQEDTEESIILKQKASSKRGEIVRALTPTKKVPMTSSLNFQHIESHQPIQRSPVSSDERRKSPDVFSMRSPSHMKKTSPKQMISTEEISSELNKSLYNQIMMSNSNTLNTNKVAQHNNTINSRTSFPDKHAYSKNLINITNKNLSFIATNNPKNNDMHLGEMSPSKQLFLSARREKTPHKCTGRSPPVSGHNRRSPELPTPPETPDDAQVDDDEVFSYDDLVCKSDITAECCDLNTFRQNLESTPRRDLSHLRRNQEKSPSLRTLSGKRTSPFSPAHSLAEMHMGDRQLTKKRLSFDDDMPCHITERRHHSTENETNQRNEFVPPSLSVASHSQPSLDFRSESPRSAFSNLDQIFASPKSMQQSPVGSPHGHIPLHSVSSQGQGTGGIIHFKSTSAHHTSTDPSPSRPSPSYNSGPQIVERTLSPFQRHPTQSPVQEAMAMIGNVLARHVRGTGHQVNSPSRLRILSDGDDVTDGSYWHGATEDAELCSGRPRGQTLSGYAKRRRIDTLGQDGRLECSLLPTASSQEASTLSIVTPTTSTTFTAPLCSSSTSPTISSPPHHVPPSLKNAHLPEEEPVESCACTCATIERIFMKMAEGAYKRIRCLDAPPNDFERFRHELAQTNDILRESMAVVKNIKAMCDHDKQTDRNLKDIS